LPGLPEKPAHSDYFFIANDKLGRKKMLDPENKKTPLPAVRRKEVFDACRNGFVRRRDGFSESLDQSCLS
jgi:hypothetical protein